MFLPLPLRDLLLFQVFHGEFAEFDDPAFTHPGLGILYIYIEHLIEVDVNAQVEYHLLAPFEAFAEWVFFVVFRPVYFREEDFNFSHISLHRRGGSEDPPV